MRRSPEEQLASRTLMKTTQSLVKLNYLWLDNDIAESCPVRTKILLWTCGSKQSSKETDVNTSLFSDRRRPPGGTQPAWCQSPWGHREPLLANAIPAARQERGFLLPRASTFSLKETSAGGFAYIYVNINREWKRKFILMERADSFPSPQFAEPYLNNQLRLAIPGAACGPWAPGTAECSAVWR